ncbi:MAG: F0F1 ATP synthase subunit delta [Marmoricola sp.]
MLRGASAEAEAQLTSELEGSKGAAGKLGEELFGVAAVLRGEAALRRIFTDASIDAPAKADLAGNVFGNALGETALGVVKSAVQLRWTSPRDLADVIEQLGVLAAVRSAGNDGGRISDELFEVRRVIDETAGLRTALSDPARSASDKSGLLRSLFSGKVLPASQLLLEQAAAGTHGAIDGALEDYQHTAAQANGEKLATVHTARQLSDVERTRLAEALGAQYGTPVHLQVVVDPEVVGGLRVEIGDDVIDGTVSGRLEDAQRRLAG